MSENGKDDKEYLVLVAGKVAPSVKGDLHKILAHKEWTESQYVRRVIEQSVKRDLAKLKQTA